MMTLYPPKLVCLAIGMKAGSLRSWHNAFKLATEGPITGEGEARRRSYTFEDVLAVAVMARLMRRGISRGDAAHIVNSNRQCFARPFWLTITPGQPAEEFYALPGRKIEPADVFRKPDDYEAIGKNSPADVAELLEPDDVFDGAVREDFLVVAVHAIADDLKRKLDLLAK